TRQIAVDFAEHGIVCNAIAPGKIVVPREGGQDPELLAYAYARTPWPRLGEPEYVAALGVFLASDECRFMTGANVLIDGGFMAYLWNGRLPRSRRERVCLPSRSTSSRWWAS